MAESNSSLTVEIAHVLFMDIVGYSKLPMDEQEHLLAQLNDLVRNTAAFTRAQASDQLIRLPTGDGMALVFFGDAEAPVRCALELGQPLRNLQALPLRMGIHTGPVYRIADINANRNVAGGGINIAQRVMDCGDAGHILVSGAEAEIIGQVSAWSGALHDLGDAEVKHGVQIHLYNVYTNEAGNPELPQKLRAANTAAATARFKARTRRVSLVAVAVAVAMILAITAFLYSRKARALGPADTIVLADFTNTTGDAVFDGALRQGLAVQLEQSPFLSLVSEAKVQETLRLMGQPTDARLTLAIARHLCQRTGSAAVLDGSIASLGSQYIVGLRALNCRTGDTLTEEQERATGKEQVLAAMDKAAVKLRANLGESLSTVQKFDTPLEQATTPSLEALKAYSLGQKTLKGKNDPAAAVPFFQRAIRLDPNFAMAYSLLGTSYFDLGEIGLTAESIKKAYDLRERVSEREKFSIESAYYDSVIGDLEKARRVYEFWGQTYPRDDAPRTDLGMIYLSLGQYDKVLSQAREAFSLDPANGQSYANLVSSYLYLNRLGEARATAEEAQAKKLDSPALRDCLYHIAFLQNDAAGMAQQVAWSAGKPGVEDMLLTEEADTAAYFGHLVKAREFSHRAVASAERAEEKETAAGYEAGAALREALFGNAAEARQRAAAALALSTGRDVQYGAALALALAGDAVRAQALVDDLARHFPEDTVVQFNYLPTIRAQFALSRNDHERSRAAGALKAVDALQAAASYELGSENVTPALYPVYVRGAAYLAARQGSEAAAEFQKILGWRGVVVNESIGSLAHLGLARAYALEGDTAKARNAYQDFLALWKDADPNVPILQQAKAEYAKLR